MKKVVKIIIGIIGFLVVAGLVFYFWQYYKQKQEENLGYIQFNGFAKQEVNGEVYFENKEAGLKFKVPQGWNYYESHIASMALSSPDFVDFKETDSTKSFIPKTGCWIGVSVKNSLSDDADYAITKDRLSHSDLLETINTEKDNYSVVIISGEKMLKTNHLSDTNKDNVGNFIYIDMAKKNKFYSIETSIFGDDKEKCSQIFDEFLTSISIK